MKDPIALPDPEDAILCAVLRAPHPLTVWEVAAEVPHLKYSTVARRLAYLARIGKIRTPFIGVYV